MSLKSSIDVIFPLSDSVNNLLHFIDILNRRGQILVAVLRDQDIIFNSHTTNVPILVQNVVVDVCSMDWISQVWLNDEPTEVNLLKLIS